VDRYCRPEVPGSETYSSTAAANGQITQGDHADELLAAGEDGEAPNLVLRHQARGVLDILILEPIDHVGGHDGADVGRPRITARGHRPHGNIAVR
jgi:hypothetical protein